MIRGHHFNCKTLILCLLLGLLSLNCTAQTDIGIEIQAYPTGLIPGIRAEWGWGEQQSVHLRLGYNIVRHRDLGEHEDERGVALASPLAISVIFSLN